MFFIRIRKRAIPLYYFLDVYIYIIINAPISFNTWRLQNNNRSIHGVILLP